MFGKFHRRQPRGRPPRTDAIDRPSREAGRHARMRVSSGLAQVEIAGIPFVRGTGSTGTSFWAKLTSHVAGGEYNWTLMTENGSTLLPDADVTGTARDVNGNATIICPVVVRLFLDSPSGVYRFQIHSCD